MTQTFQNNQHFRLITSSLSENEIIAFSQLLNAIRPTPELTGLNRIVIRLMDCYKIAKNIKWPHQLQISLDSKIYLLNKIISDKNFDIPKLFSSANPIFKRLKEYPVAGLYCQSFSSKLTINKQESLLFIQHLIFLLLIVGKSNDELIKNGCDELRKLITAEKPYLMVIFFEKLDGKILPSNFDLLIEKGKITFQRQLSSAWRNFIRNELKVTTIPLPDNKQQKTSSKNTAHISPSMSHKTHFKTKNHRVYTTTKKTNYIPLRSINVEVDNALIETIEFITKDGVELDRRTKQAHILSQNRLCWLNKNILLGVVMR